MKAGKTISELAQHVTDLRARAVDYRIPGSTLYMGEDRLLRVNGQPGLAIAPNRLMHNQLAERLGIPVRYYDKMLAETPVLLKDNVNEWLRRGNGEKRFIRTYRDVGNADAPLTGRAFLGSTYRPLDNYDLVTAIVPPMLSAGVEIVSSEVTESKIYIQAISQKFEAKVYRPGTHDRINDVLKIGVVVSNSEVGGGALSVQALVWRQVCTNGLIVTEDFPGFKQIHIGRVDVDDKILSDQSRKLRDAAIWSKAEDVVRAAVSQSTLDKVAVRMNTIAGIELANPEKAVELVAERFDLVEDERAAIMKNLIAGGDVSQWGLTNAVTALANEIPSYDRAVELETIGGKVAGLPAQLFGQN